MKEFRSDAVDAIASEVTERGAAIVRDIVPPELIERLRIDLLRAMAEDDTRFGDRHPFPGMVHALMLRGRSFVELLGVEAVRSVSRAILGHGAIVHAYNSSSLPPRATNYAGRIHVDSPRVIDHYPTNVGLCFPLDDFRIENGAMEIWPESFRLREAPSSTDFDRNKVVLAGLRAGDVVVFNSRCWHQSGTNGTSEWRRAVTINVCRAYMRQQFDFPRMIPNEIAGALSEDVRQFLGYHVRMPAALEEFFAPPDERPYRPGQE